MCVDSDWVTPLRISPQTCAECTGLFPIEIAPSSDIPVAAGRRINVHQYGIHAQLLVTLNSRFTSEIFTSVLIDTESGSSFRGACVNSSLGEISPWTRPVGVLPV